MTNKRIVVVGDWIRSPIWAEPTYYEVVQVTNTTLWVKVEGFPPVSYPIKSHEWEFKPLPFEEAISLLTSLGYTVTEPPAKKNGVIAIYSNGNDKTLIWSYTTREEVKDVWNDWYHKLIAIVDWTEGDGI